MIVMGVVIADHEAGYILLSNAVEPPAPAVEPFIVMFALFARVVSGKLLQYVLPEVELVLVAGVITIL